MRSPLTLFTLCSKVIYRRYSEMFLYFYNRINLEEITVKDRFISSLVLLDELLLRVFQWFSDWLQILTGKDCFFLAKFFCALISGVIMLDDLDWLLTTWLLFGVMIWIVVVSFVENGILSETRNPLEEVWFVRVLFGFPYLFSFFIGFFDFSYQRIANGLYFAILYLVSCTPMPPGAFRLKRKSFSSS